MTRDYDIRVRADVRTQAARRQQKCVADACEPERRDDVSMLT